MFRSKLNRVLALRRHDQGRAAEALAGAHSKVTNAQQTLEDVESVQQDYWQKELPNSAHLLAAQANFLRQLDQVVEAQRKQVSTLQADLQNAQTTFAQKRADYELLANLLKKRERLHNQAELKRLIRTQTPTCSTKL